MKLVRGGAAQHTRMAERSSNLYPESRLLRKIQRCRIQARTSCSYGDDALIQFTCSCLSTPLCSRLFHEAHNTEHALRIGTKCAARHPLVRCAVARRLQHNDIGAHWKRHPQRSSRSVYARVHKCCLPSAHQNVTRQHHACMAQIFQFMAPAFPTCPHG